MVNAQEYLNNNYPNKEEREKIKTLDLSNLNLTGDLDLSDFPSLEEINTNGNPDLGT